MPDQLQLRGGTTAEHTSFTGASKEVTIDTTKKTAVVHDASTAGGNPLMREDGANSALINGSATEPALAFAAGDADNGIYSPGADQVAISTAGEGRLFVDADGRVGVGTAADGSAQFRSLTGTSGKTWTAPTGTTALFERNSINYVTIAAANNNTSQLNFADTDDADIGNIKYNHSEDSLAFGVNNSERARIVTDGRLLVGVSTSSGANATIQSIGTHPLSLHRGVDTNGGPNFSLTKSRNTTYGSNTIVSNNDTLGTIQFRGDDGTDYVSAAAYIQGVVDGTPGEDDMPGRLVFSTTAVGASSPTTRMTIKADGKVGINETDPAKLLDVGSVVGDGISIGSTPAGTITRETEGLRITGSSTNKNISFVTSGSEACRIDTSGRLLVGKNTSQDDNALIQAYKSSGSNYMWVESEELSDGEYSMYRAYGNTSGGAVRQTMIGLYKHADITNAGPFIFLEAEDGANRYYWTDNSDEFRSSAAASHIGTTNGAVVGTQTSDERIKNVSGNVSYGLAEVLQLQPKQYALKTEPDTNKLGFIAQEVESIIPEAVFDTGEELEGHQEGDRTKLGMEYVQLIPVLVNAIKEQQATITDLQTRLAALEAQ